MAKAKSTSKTTKTDEPTKYVAPKTPLTPIAQAEKLKDGKHELMYKAIEFDRFTARAVCPDCDAAFEQALLVPGEYGDSKEQIEQDHAEYRKLAEDDE